MNQAGNLNYKIMKRRDFVKKSGILSAGVLTSTYAIGAIKENFSANNTINIGVIGTGARGGGLIPVMNTIANINVIGCCDVLPFRLNEGMKRAGKNTKAYTDYRNLLDNKSIDAVLITTPFNTHSSIAIDAIDAGKHVYCEKTMAKGIEGIQKLVQKGASSKKIFQVGHQHHSSKLYKHVVELIRKGEIGNVLSFECQWNRNGDWRRPVPKPSLERAINWRMYREYSGGLAAELSSHQIDFVSWVLNENPKKIMGIGGVDSWKDGRETYDNIHLLFEYPSGVKATFTCLTKNALGGYQIKVFGSKGTMQIRPDEVWVSYEKGYEKEFEDVDGVSGATINLNQQRNGTQIKMPQVKPSKQALVDFRDSIINNTTPVSNIHRGANTAIAVQKSLDAMYDEKIIFWE